MFNNLKIEFMKIKRSNIFLVATFFPILAVIQGFSFAKNIKGQEEIDLWGALFSGSTLMYGMLILPIFITIIFAIITRIEHSNNGWKQLLSLPIRREDVYISKLILGCIAVLYNLVVFLIGILISGIILGGKGSIPLDIIVLRPLLAFISSLPIIAIQFYISFKFKNVGVPLGVGAIFTLPTILIANSTKYWIFYPWTYPVLTMMPNFVTSAEQTLRYGIMYGVSILSFISIIGVGLYKFRSKDII
ncbi:ABC transporter permease [Clostridium sp. D2Q-11]|uniref:ABC transporter permease n=1 Tax=Anaeromonas frigoriresistens TaxID=2683708 RepID=A0A942UWP1_9FIRM|nr:ABC transporter permease [Anaeromonas frigoriresistens]MBS4538930.1 ABC transporter permease [Anaeromonas frigoriresistens]